MEGLEVYESAVAEEEALPEPEAAPAPKGETVCWAMAPLSITPTAAVGGFFVLQIISCCKQKATKVLSLHKLFKMGLGAMLCMDTVSHHWS